MTRRQLKEMGLPQEQIDQIIALHADTVEALRREQETQLQQSAAERSALEEELQRARNTAAQLEACEHRRTLRQMLLQQGANPAAVPLMLQCVQTESIPRMADGQPDYEVVVASLKALGAELFAQTEQQGVPTLEPLTDGGMGLTRQSLSAMTSDEINGCWSEVKEALR